MQKLGYQDLRNYQKYAQNMLYDNPKMLLGIDMSMGKTVIVLSALERLYKEFSFKKALIVAPLRVATDTWPDEFERWEHIQSLKYSVVRVDDDHPELKKYSANNRTQIKYAMMRKVVEDTNPINIINKEAMPWLVSEYQNDWPYDVLIIDESSMLKSWKMKTKTKNHKQETNLTRFGAIASVRHHHKKIWLLTGTPCPNSIKDLGGQAFILDGGERLGKYKTHFEKQYFYNPPHNPHVFIPFKDSHSNIMNKMKDIMFTLRAEDYLELPERIYNIIQVKLPEKILKKYKKFERTLVAEFLDVRAKNRADLTNKLLQFANGSVYRKTEDGDCKEVKEVHRVKLDALESIIEEASGESVLIFYAFQFDRDLIKKKFPQAVLFDEDKDFVKKWNEKKIKIGLAHPASIGHGMNLQHGGRIAVHYGLTWSLELYQQSNKRLHRPGQDKNVIIHHIICKDTVDEDVVKALQNKATNQDLVIDSVRKRMQQVEREMKLNAKL